MARGRQIDHKINEGMKEAHWHATWKPVPQITATRTNVEPKSDHQKAMEVLARCRSERQRLIGLFRDTGIRRYAEDARAVSENIRHLEQEVGE